MGGAPTDVELRTQLHHLGLRVKEVAADGNCFFRALSDQRWGGEEHHVDLRKRICSVSKASDLYLHAFSIKYIRRYISIAFSLQYLHALLLHGTLT